MKKLLFGLLGFLFFLTSCSSNRLVSNGAYSDVSLTRDSKEYDIKRLQEITSEGKSIFGIPFDKNVGRRYGTVVRFNGVEISGTKRLLPILTMVGLTFGTSSLIQEIGGRDTQSYDYNIGTIPSYLIAIPIAGALNNQLWSESSTSRAFQRFNRELVQNNPDIDVFLNPKYEIQTDPGIWISTTKIKGKVMGATLKIK